jgi:O-antigen ligase
MNRLKAARIVRRVFAVVLISLVFTNLFGFLTGMGDSDYAATHTNLTHLRQSGIPPYAIRDFGFVVAALVVLLDVGSVRRLLESRLFRWAFCMLILYTWAMLHRTMEAPAGMPLYDLMLPFFSRVNMLAFMVSCIVIFDGSEVLSTTRGLVVLATLAGVVLNGYDLVYPGTFSESPGRAAGLYMNANGSGMALLVGCLIGLPAVSRNWREVFVVVALVGVLTTFSREAIICALVVIIAASIARTLSLPRLVACSGLAILLLAAFSVGQVLEGGGVLTSDNLGRLTIETNDGSAAERLDVATKTLQAFEDAPFFGQGIGTDEYWSYAPAHNLYLRLMADNGLVGILIIPALVFSLRRNSWDFYAFAVVFLIWCLFDHFILTSPFALICLAIEGAESAEHKQTSSKPFSGRFSSSQAL